MQMLNQYRILTSVFLNVKLESVKDEELLLADMSREEIEILMT